MLDEGLGRLHFWLMVIGFNLTFFVQHFLGLMGMPRRVYTYPDLPHWGQLNMISTVGAFVLGGSTLVLAVNIVRSLRTGAAAGNNPWNAWTLEWAAASPPPEHNFDAVPPVRSNRPLWDLAYPAAPDAPVGPDEPADAKRPVAAKVAVLSFIASETAFFVLLIIAYVFYTATSKDGPTPNSALDWRLTGLFTVLLLSSSFTLHRAEKNHAAQQHSASVRWLGLTVALGFAFLIGQITEYRRMFHDGIVMNTNLFATGFFTLTGFHGIHVLVGLIALTILFALLVVRELRGSLAHGLRAVGYYWHFVDVVWVVVFSVVYLRGAL
jgi:heme/copper-type cytochrome/quinol oxidase subunit 3